MRTRRWFQGRATVATAALAGLLIAFSAYADTYTVTPLSSGFAGRARDLSATGAVCGVDAGHAFVWRPSSPNAASGTETILASLIQGFSSDAYAVNSSGFVVGHTGDNPLQQHEVPVVWNPDGSITELPLFHGVTSGGMATGISDAGRITGRNGVFVSDAGAARWSTDGTGVYLGIPQDYALSYGWKINLSGVISGTAELGDGTSRAFTHANGVFTLLPLLPNASMSSAYDINDAGHVVGSSTFSAATAFFYNGSTVVGLANVPGDLIQVSTALGVNNHDRVVGYANPTPNLTGALIWDTPSSAPSYLNGRIDPSSPGYISAANPGWFITEAVAINDAGQIAARGFSTSGGPYRALLLTPVSVTTDVEGAGLGRLALAVAPNPARGPIAVQVTLPETGPARVHVVDLAGRRIATLHEDLVSAGSTTLTWEGRTADGRRLPPGVYLVRLQTANHAVCRRFVIM